MTGMQARFVEAFVGEANANASEAARLAGYAEGIAAKIGSRNLKNPAIQAAIVERLRNAALSSDEILARLGDQARGVGMEFYSILEDGRVMLDLPKLLRAGKGHLILELTHTEHGLRVKFASCQSALIQLERRHRLLVERQEGSDSDGVAVTMAVTAALEKIYGS